MRHGEAVDHHRDAQLRVPVTPSNPAAAPVRSPGGRVTRSRTVVRRAGLTAGVGLLLLAGACSTGDDAAVFGGTFTFVSPDGARDLAYPPEERGTVGNLSGTDVTDESRTVSLDDYAGEVVVLNFWGSWCSPCRAEADDLNAASDDLAADGVRFLGLNVRDTRSGAADFAAGKQTPYPSIYDPGMTTLLSLRGFPTGSIPSTIVLDEEHRVARIWLGAVSAADLVPAVREIAAE